ncbi:MAG: hypothetical protein NE327_12410 [Lentisphaeraceae bacterium]|nr:hypothetical protein [Lentisphaeraceae bacterium]
MDTAESFIDAFSNGEILEIPINSWPGGQKKMNIRRLPRSLVNEFRKISAKITQSQAASFLGKNSKEFDDDLAKAENYLIQNSISDPTGKLIFEDPVKFNDFLKVAHSEVITEILTHIECFNKIHGDFLGKEEVLKSYKKKLESSD